MKEIKIVFRIGESEYSAHTFFDLFVDGEKQEDVKKFAISLTNEPNEVFTYQLEKYINLDSVFKEYEDKN